MPLEEIEYSSADSSYREFVSIDKLSAGVAVRSSPNKNRDLADGFIVEELNKEFPKEDGDTRRGLWNLLQLYLDLPNYVTKLTLTMEANQPTTVTATYMAPKTDEIKKTL